MPHSFSIRGYHLNKEDLVLTFGLNASEEYRRSAGDGLPCSGLTAAETLLVFALKFNGTEDYETSNSHHTQTTHWMDTISVKGKINQLKVLHLLFFQASNLFSFKVEHAYGRRVDSEYWIAKTKQEMLQTVHDSSLKVQELNWLKPIVQNFLDEAHKQLCIEPSVNALNLAADASKYDAENYLTHPFFQLLVLVHKNRQTKLQEYQATSFLSRMSSPKPDLTTLQDLTTKYKNLGLIPEKYTRNDKDLGTVIDFDKVQADAATSMNAGVVLKK